MTRQSLLKPAVIIATLTWLGANAHVVTAATPPPCADDRYEPIPGGWRIHLHGNDSYKDIASKNQIVRMDGRDVPGVDPVTGRLTPTAPIGLLLDNPRLHWRPLYPPGEKSLLWTPAELDRTERVSFRPLVLARLTPRFLLDDHSAGGLMGHLCVGMTSPDKGGKWFHDWSEITVRYTAGRMDYTLTDDAFPGTTVHMVATAMAGSAGVAVRIEVAGAPEKAMLVWGYGGASAYYTNHRLVGPPFTFAPEQCAKDKYVLKDSRFELTRAFDKSDEVISGEGKTMCVMRYLPEWTAHIRGGSSWHGQMGFAPPEKFDADPGALVAAAFETGDAAAIRARTNCVVVEKVPLNNGAATGTLVIGMGGDIDAALADPAGSFDAGLARNQAIADRIVTHTPDAYLDAAMPMMAYSTEGLWASQAYLHGTWSWRFAYLGWRTLYGPTLYGWTDRVRRCIENHCRLGLIKDGPDAGALGIYLEQAVFYYNMNEVFLDMVRHYFDYTNDLDLMKKIFPVLQSMVERENRRLRPGPEYLYENVLNTWISDSHWYIRAQCTQASAYMMGTHAFLADLADRLGMDGTPYREQVAKIRADLQRVLWQKRLGVFAECLDTRGNRMLHPEPELPTLYHAAEFGAADEPQIWQMLHWADTHLRQERTPGEGHLYWSSNWFPNRGRSYTHSTYEVAYGEEFNFAETQYLAGRSDAGYAILRAGLSGIFNGPTPGGLSCHSFVDGTQRGIDQFADAISMWGRAVVEGMFGIKVRRPREIVELTPQLPADWPRASIRTPHFSYEFSREQGTVRINWKSPVATAVRLRLPLQAAGVRAVKVDGQPAQFTCRKGIGATWLETLLPKSNSGNVEVSFAPDVPPMAPTIAIKEGDPLKVSLPALAIGEWSDPQELLADARIEAGALHGKVVGKSGPGALFVSESGRACPRWIPVAVDIAPAKPVERRRWKAPEPGEHDLSRWSLVDLRDVFNTSPSEMPKRVKESAVPLDPAGDQIGFEYWLHHLAGYPTPPRDDAWRAKVDRDGVAWTTDGIPFRTRKEGQNLGVTMLHSKAFPANLPIPVRAAGRDLYLMLLATTYPAQSQVVNFRVTLRYADGSSQAHDLVNPTDIGDCWLQGWGPHHDTEATGFENIGGRSGPAGSSQVENLAKPIALDTYAHLIAFPLKSGVRLDKVELEAVANDVILGVMGASVLK